MTQSEKRLKLLKIMEKDENEISVSAVLEIFHSILKLQIEHSETFNNVKKRLTDDEWYKFLHALTLSFSTSLYCSAAKDEEELLERAEQIKDAIHDIGIGFAIKEEERKADA